MEDFLWANATICRVEDSSNIKHCNSERAKLKLAINLAFACSLRIGELLGLTWSCIDISEESIKNGTAYVYVNKELQRVDRAALRQLEEKDVIIVDDSKVTAVLNSGTENVFHLEGNDSGRVLTRAESHGASDLINSSHKCFLNVLCRVLLIFVIHSDVHIKIKTFIGCPVTGNHISGTASDKLIAEGELISDYQDDQQVLRQQLLCPGCRCHPLR